MKKISFKQDFAQGVLRRSKTSPLTLHVARESVFRLFILITSNQWEIKSIDVKTTFLQGEQIERTVYLRVPKKENTLSIWKFQKCVYCLADAIRYWYLHVREELVRLRAKLSCIDPGIFYWQDDSGLIGIFVYHANDMTWGGNEYFKTNV